MARIDVRQALANISDPVDDSKMAVVKQVYKMTGMAKMKGIAAFLATLISKSVKFIVFAFHNDVLNYIEESIKFHKTSYIRLDQTVPYTKRHDLVQKFQNDPACKIAVCSLLVAQGDSLTAASTVVLAELHWDQKLIAQAEDRVAKIGKNSAISVYNIIASDTLDDDFMLRTTEPTLAPIQKEEEEKAPIKKEEEEKLPVQQEEHAKTFGGFQFVNKKKANAEDITDNELFLALEEQEQNELIELVCLDNEENAVATGKRGIAGMNALYDKLWIDREKADPESQMEPPRKTKSQVLT